MTATDTQPEVEQPEFAVIDGRFVQLGHIAPDGTQVPLVHRQHDDGITGCGAVFYAKGVLSTTEATDVTCGACESAVTS